MVLLLSVPIFFYHFNIKGCQNQEESKEKRGEGKIKIKKMKKRLDKKP
jgi:hypothetical protein